MLTIHASDIDAETAHRNELTCAIVDYANIAAAEQQKVSEFQGCTFTPAHAVAIQPSEDQVIPIFMCTIHFNSFKLGLREGVAIDKNIL